MDLDGLDGAWNNLSSQYDFLVDPAEYFGLSGGFSSGADEQYLWQEIANSAFSLTIKAFEEAYKYGDDSSAVEYFEQFALPAMRRYHGLGGDNILDLNYWANRGNREIGKVSMDPRFHKPLGKNAYEDLYEAVKDEFGQDEFDHLVGVFSGGMPVLSLVGAYFDGDEVIVRYSHLKRDDREVQVTGTMDERSDFSDSSVLIVDDVVGTGDTMEEVGEFIAERGADEIYGVDLDRQFYTFEQGPVRFAEQKDLETGEVREPRVNTTFFSD